MTDANTVTYEEIARRLNVDPMTPAQWARRRESTGFPEPTGKKGARLTWHWPVVREWARDTGRLWE